MGANEDTWDKPLTAAEADNLVSASPIEISGARMTLRQWLAAGFLRLDNTGVLHWNIDTSGKSPVTETSGATIASTAGLISNATTFQNAQLMFGPANNATAAAAKMQHRIGLVPLTEAAGSIAATDIVPAVAGYTACARILGVYAPAGTTDPANTWTFTIAAGTIIGPAIFDMALTQKRFHPFDLGSPGVGNPMPMCGTVAAGADDNKAMQVAAAGLAVVGATYWLVLETWYET